MVIQTVADQMIHYAYTCRASDIYLLPQTDHYEFWIKSQEQRRFIAKKDFNEMLSLISYFKYNAQMNISESRRPQSGALSFDLGHTVVQLRLSSIGNFKNQESLVIRLLYDQDEQLNFFFDTQVQQLQAAVRRRGLFVFSGATGSGKTTTMYMLAKQIAKTETVIAIEDPVEIRTPEILQLQVNEQAQMGYLELLKGTLRHRPDTLIIGEIRDAHTAQVAATAALSGHLVFTTVHARSTGGVLERLLDLGLSKNILENTLTTVCYQRLLPDIEQTPRVLCDILTGTQLEQQLQQPQQQFVNWAENLKKLYTQQWIDQQTYQKFQAG